MNQLQRESLGDWQADQTHRLRLAFEKALQKTIYERAEEYCFFNQPDLDERVIEEFAQALEDE